MQILFHTHSLKIDYLSIQNSFPLQGIPKCLDDIPGKVMYDIIDEPTSSSLLTPRFITLVILLVSTHSSLPSAYLSNILVWLWFQSITSASTQRPFPSIIFSFLRLWLSYGMFYFHVRTVKVIWVVRVIDVVL